jgi:hypothetical protein
MLRAFASLHLSNSLLHLLHALTIPAGIHASAFSASRLTLADWQVAVRGRRREEARRRAGERAPQALRPLPPPSPCATRPARAKEPLAARARRGARLI